MGKPCKMLPGYGQPRHQRPGRTRHPEEGWGRRPEHELLAHRTGREVRTKAMKTHALEWTPPAISTRAGLGRGNGDAFAPVACGASVPADDHRRPWDVSQTDD